MDDIPTRVRRAAEDWAREVLGREATAVTEVQRITQVDGSVRANVEVSCDEPGTSATLVHCLVTLEPDGRISCYSPDTPGES